jgi:hypothetical protein
MHLSFIFVLYITFCVGYAYVEDKFQDEIRRSEYRKWHFGGQKCKRFLGNPTRGPPFCAMSRATVKFQNGSGPGTPAPSTFEILPRSQPRSQALSYWELGDNHGLAPVALFFAESDHGQPRRQGWQISNISILSYVSNPCLPNCQWSDDFWLCGLYSVTHRDYAKPIN